jgi:hypothetical protein
MHHEWRESKRRPICKGYGVFLLLDTGTVRPVKPNCVSGQVPYNLEIAAHIAHMKSKSNQIFFPLASEIGKHPGKWLLL